MSEKDAKKKRQEEKVAAGEPYHIGDMVLECFSDGSVRSVKPLPHDPHLGVLYMHNASMLVANHFIQQAMKRASAIQLARPGATPEDIIKMSRGN